MTDKILPILKGLPLVDLTVSSDGKAFSAFYGGCSDGGLEGLIREVPTLKQVRVKPANDYSGPVSQRDTVLFGRASMAGTE